MERRSEDLAQLVRQQESLREVIESISSELELRPLLTCIVQNACELLGAENGTIGLVDEERQVVCTEAAYRMPLGELGAASPPGVGIFGQVYLTHQPIIMQRYGDVDKPQRLELLDYAVIGVPIFWHEQLLGVFGLGSPPPRRFTESDVQVITLYAKHAAIAIINARQFEEQQRRTARITAINRIGQLLTSQLSVSELLQTAVEAIYEHLDYPNIAVLLVAPDDSETLVLSARSGNYASASVGEYRQSIHEGIIGAAARSGQPVLTNDIRSDPRYIAVPGAPELCAELAVPIVYKQKLFGVLNLESERVFSPEDAQGIRVIADQLGIAIENARLFGELERALAESKLMYETSHRISAALDVDQVIQAYLSQVAARGQYTCNVALYEFNAAGERTGVNVRGRWSPSGGSEPLDEHVPYTHDSMDSLLDAGQTIMVADVYTDSRASPELRALQAESKRPALALIPLLARGQRIGLVVLSYHQAHAWQAADLQLYQATAAQLATAIDSRRQQLLLYERGQQLAVLEERQRLARDLHDSVTQLIFSITLIAQSIAPAWKRDAAEGQRRAERLLELAQNALAEMRALLNELRPAEFESARVAEESVVPGILRLRREGLVATLRLHLQDAAREGLEIKFDADGYTPLPYAREEALYRITQEALNNIFKHARAAHIEIKLSADAAAVRLTVRDDGCGFVVGQPTSSGMGLHTMRERAEALGGKFHLHSVPDKGTVLQVTLPKENLPATK